MSRVRVDGGQVGRAGLGRGQLCRDAAGVACPLAQLDCQRASLRQLALQVRRPGLLGFLRLDPLSSLPLPGLPANAANLYFRDGIGNISSSAVQRTETGVGGHDGGSSDQRALLATLCDGLQPWGWPRQAGYAALSVPPVRAMEAELSVPGARDKTCALVIQILKGLPILDPPPPGASAPPAPLPSLWRLDHRLQVWVVCRGRRSARAGAGDPHALHHLWSQRHRGGL